MRYGRHFAELNRVGWSVKVTKDRWRLGRIITEAWREILPVSCVLATSAQSYAGRNAHRYLLVSDRDLRSWPHRWIESPQNIHRALPRDTYQRFVRSLQMLFLLPQESPEGWDSSALIRGSRQKKPSKGWMARSPAVLQNRLLWSLPTTPARSPARPCFPSYTSPLTGATLVLSTTRLKGSGRHACYSLQHHQYGMAHGQKTYGSEGQNKANSLCPTQAITVGHSPEHHLPLL